MKVLTHLSGTDASQTCIILLVLDNSQSILDRSQTEDDLSQSVFEKSPTNSQNLICSEAGDVPGEVTNEDNPGSFDWTSGTNPDPFKTNTGEAASDIEDVNGRSAECITIDDDDDELENSTGGESKNSVNFNY